MSNLIFPAPEPQQWGMPWPIKKNPAYKTLVQSPANQRGEVRLPLASYPTWEWDVNLGYIKGDMSSGQSGSAFQEIVGFLGQMQGSTSDWLYFDPYDNSCTGQILGYGDGTAQAFQLVRSTGGMVDLMQTALPVNVYIDDTPIPAGPQPSGAQWYCGIENLALSSQGYFGEAPWALENCEASDKDQVAPDGTETAATLHFTSAGGVLYQLVTVPTVVPAQVTFSVWLHGVNPGDAPVNVSVFFFNQSGTTQIGGATTVANLSPSAWQRFQVTATIPQQAGTQVAIEVSQPTLSGDPFCWIWGAQLERWTEATGYCPTTDDPYIPMGQIIFGAAPATGRIVTADFSFWYRCRFSDDQWGLNENLYQIWDLPSLKFKSLIF